MSWWRRIVGRAPLVQKPVIDAITAYKALPLPDHELPTLAMRFVVADVETTGLNPFRDRLISIGAVVVRDGTIEIGRAFDSVLRQAAPSDERNILLHGIDGTTQLAGNDPAEALAGFLTFAGCSPVIGYHVDFDRIMIERAMRRVLNVKPRNDWLDLAPVLAALFPERAREGRGLDFWSDAFGIQNPARHNALADAFATAQLLLVALSFGAKLGHVRYADLYRLAVNQRWLEITSRR